MHLKSIFSPTAMEVSFRKYLSDYNGITKKHWRFCYFKENKSQKYFRKGYSLNKTNANKVKVKKGKVKTQLSKLHNSEFSDSVENFNRIQKNKISSYSFNRGSVNTRGIYKTILIKHNSAKSCKCNLDRSW